MVLIGFSLDNHLVQQIFYVGSAESKDVEDVNNLYTKLGVFVFLLEEVKVVLSFVFLFVK